MEFGVKWLIFLSDERKRPHKNESTKSPSLSCDRGLFSLFMRKKPTIGPRPGIISDSVGESNPMGLDKIRCRIHSPGILLVKKLRKKCVRTVNGPSKKFTKEMINSDIWTLAIKSSINYGERLVSFYEIS
ncbi:unnamed protein product [Rotaria socialis]